MNKKLISMALLVCSIPVAANASWTFNTWAKSAGGTIASRNNAAQTSVNGSVFASYTTHSTKLTASVTAAAGYDISNVTLNGISLGAQASPYTNALISGGAGANVAQSLYATFRAKLLPVTASVSLLPTENAGSVTPTSISNIYAGKTISPLTFTFQPKSGAIVKAIAGATGFTVSDALPAAVNKAVKVTIPTGTTLSAAVALVGSFDAALAPANAGPDQATIFNKLVTLTGTGTGAWSQVSGPAVTLTGSNPVTFTTGAVNATYVFSYGGDQVNVVVDMDNAANVTCVNCHNQNGIGQTPNVYNAWTASNHKTAGLICYDCHNGANAGGHPGSVAVTSCTPCHNAAALPEVLGAAAAAAAHTGQTTNAAEGCIACHSVAQNAGTDFVQDNNGVRSITQEFTKWSHHVTGVSLQNAHCAACHLEGKAVNGVIVTDPAKHMADNKIHLRNATTDADMQWDPAAPNHTTMDNFCMTCHSATGYSAPSAAAIQAIMVPAVGKTASASNPFGDTISNRYDKMQRPAVVDVDGQFDTTNNSHHAVKGARYTGKTRVAGTRQIANPAAFTNGSTASLFGKRSTIYDSVNANNGRNEKDAAQVGAANVNPAFNALYVPLGTVNPPTAATELGDDSTLHCGDCHTVGQWKAGVATNAAGVLNTVAIGAHGSNNEYLLRNDKGIDERHTQDTYLTGNGTLKNPITGLVIPLGVIEYTNPNAANLVCFNCHAYKRYGSVYAATGTTGPHAGEYDASGRCNSQANSLPFNGYTTGTATDGTQFQSRFLGPLTKYAGTAAFAPGFPLNAANAPQSAEVNPDFGNALGIQCANCHNSGSGNAYGGIHGSKNNQELEGYTIDPSVTGGAYIDGMGNTTKIMRFLPGLGDAMHVPGTLGGVTGGTTAKFIQYSGMTSTFNVYSATSATNRTKKYYPTRFYELPVRDNRTAVNAKVGSYNFQTGGVTSDTNWEQMGWKQLGPGSTTNAAQQMAQGAGCYTLGNSAEATPGTITTGVGFPDNNGNTIALRPLVMDKLAGPSQGVAGQSNPEMLDNWGGCDDHGAPVGGGNHGFIKRIVRPVTY